MPKNELKKEYETLEKGNDKFYDAPMNRRYFIFCSTATVAGIAMALSSSGCTVAEVEATELAKKVIIGDSAFCTSCRLCEKNCSFRWEGEFNSEYSRINVDRQRYEYTFKDGQFPISTCRQCEEAACVEACPVGAAQIAPAGTHGDLFPRIIDEEKCINCGACVAACPKDMVVIQNDKSVARQCNLCEGNEPACVKNCPSGALKLVDWDPIYEEL